jgi:hypothetical protein
MLIVGNKKYSVEDAYKNVAQKIPYPDTGKICDLSSRIPS